MAPHSSTLAWKIPWTEEPGRLQSMGLLRIWHDWATSLSTFHFHALEKEMATHSSVVAWRIRGTEEPSGLQSTGSHRVGHDWSDLAAAAAAAKRGVYTVVISTCLQLLCFDTGWPKYTIEDSWNCLKSLQATFWSCWMTETIFVILEMGGNFVWKSRVRMEEFQSLSLSFLEMIKPEQYVE